MRRTDEAAATGARRPSERGVPNGGVVALGLALLLGGCAWFDNTTNSAVTAISGAGERFGAPWGGMAANSAENSTTIARVRGVATEPTEPLLPEPGNVWPAEEAPRATLANPDAALRGIPAYQPNDNRALDRSTDAVPAGSTSRGAPNQLRGSSSPPPPPLQQPDLRQPAVTQPPPPPVAPPPIRADGQTILTPQGPVTTSGGTNRVQTYTEPGGGGGTIQRDGGFSTISPSGGLPQTFPTPR